MLSESERFRRQAEHLRKIHECDRQLLAYDFHDGFVQELIAARLTVESLIAGHSSQPTELTEKLRTELKVVHELVSSALTESRRLLDQQHAPFRDEPLSKLIEKFTANLPTQNSIHIDLNLDSRIDQLSRDLQANLLRIVQQAVYNSLFHAKAKNISIRASCDDALVKFDIADDGIGFRENDERTGIGIESMSERTALFGGEFELQSAPNQGTSIRISIPEVADF